MIRTREQMVDALGEEVLSEMADSFFGARLAIDDEVELFHERSAALKLAGQRVLSLMKLFDDLLLEREFIESFWREIGVSLAVVEQANTMEARHYQGVPWALTRKRRYIQLLERVYTALDVAAERYMNGTDYLRPGESRRLRLVGWNRYQQWAAEINARIDEVNANQSPSAVLGFARSLDTEGEARSRVAGAAIKGYVDAIDDSLSLKHVDGHDAGLGPLPDFPPLKQVKKILTRLGTYIYARYPDRVCEMMDRLAHQNRD